MLPTKTMLKNRIEKKCEAVKRYLSFISDYSIASRSLEECVTTENSVCDDRGLPIGKAYLDMKARGVEVLINNTRDAYTAGDKAELKTLDKSADVVLQDVKSVHRQLRDYADNVFRQGPPAFAEPV